MGAWAQGGNLRDNFSSRGAFVPSGGSPPFLVILRNKERLISSGIQSDDG